MEMSAELKVKYSRLIKVKKREELIWPQKNN
jgi:hypothetical protein